MEVEWRKTVLFEMLLIRALSSIPQDKFGPPAGGARSAAPPPSSSYRGDSYGGYGRDYRDDTRSGRDHHGNDLYTPSAPVNHGSHASHSTYGGDIPSGPAAGSGDQIYIRNVRYQGMNG